METSANAALIVDDGPFRLVDIEWDQPGPGEAMVRMQAASICHTDLGFRGRPDYFPRPALLGHEGAGIVESVGAGVTDIAPGDRVLASFAFCGQCPTCNSGEIAYCDQAFARNFAPARPDGSRRARWNGQPIASSFFGQSSFATRFLTDAHQLVKLPDDLPFEAAAPFGCGLQTGAGAMLNVLRPAAGAAVAVIGVGPVGLAGVMAAAMAGADPIIAVDPNPARRAAARDVGATINLEDASLLSPRSLAAALDTSGNHAALQATLAALMPHATLAVVTASATQEGLRLDALKLLMGGLSVRGVVQGDSVPREFLPTLFAARAQGKFPIDRLLARYALDEIDRAFDDMGAGRVVKPVLLP